MTATSQPPIHQSWVKNLNKFLGAQGRRKEWLADGLDMHPSQLSHLLKGDPYPALTPALQKRICDLVGVPQDMIFGDPTPEPEPEQSRNPS